MNLPKAPFLKFCLVVSAGVLSPMVSVKPEPTPSDVSPVAEMGNRHRVIKQFMEISRKVNEEPEISALREKMIAAQKAYQMAFEEVMRQREPELFNQYQAAREAMRARRPTPEGGKHSAPAVTKSQANGYDQLTTEEKTKLDVVRQTAMADSSVKEARQKRNSAKTEQERRDAVDQYRKELYEAMIRADEEVKDLLEKLKYSNE